MSTARFDAIVLAGGGARRMGGVDKAALDVSGRTLLERALSAVDAAGSIVVVGTARPLRGRGVEWCREEPPGGGPVAALAAGLRAATAPIVVVLAADLPWIAPAVPVLLAAVPADGMALLVDPAGRVNHLAAVWQRSALERAIGSLERLDGAAMRSLVADVPVVRVADPDGWGRDCDTWEDLAAARELGSLAP